MTIRLRKFFPLLVLFLTGSFLLAGCGSDDDDSSPSPSAEVTRDHDERVFTAAEPDALDPIEGATVYKGTYEGVHGPASYYIEVPEGENWNGILVMYAHGYAGTGSELGVSAPGLRSLLIGQGYAWAASSYSANYYDVRAGVEDTNALALAFEDLTENAYGSPDKYYIIGFSMGGHIAGAAVEAETLATANSVVEYAASLPMCGVMADMEEFQWLGNYTLVAQQLAGLGTENYPEENYPELLPDILDALFITSQGAVWQENDGQGAKFREIAKRLSGGERPVFLQGFRYGYLQPVVFGTGGGDGTIRGILGRQSFDNMDTIYRWTDEAEPTAAETAFNESILRIEADPEANSPRQDGVRWVPVIPGEFDVPVLTMHTLGDLYVPFVHQQKYLENAMTSGSDALLVQRAIRAPGHCDFNGTEVAEAFMDLAAWEQTGAIPFGDVILDSETVAAPDYGCQFTRATRPGVEPCPE